MHWWYDSSSSTDAAQGGYLLLVPCDVVDTASTLWSKNLATLGTKWETTLITVSNAIGLVEQIMLEEELLKLEEPLVEHLSCAGTSTRSLKSLRLPHCNRWVSAQKPIPPVLPRSFLHEWIWSFAAIQDALSSITDLPPRLPIANVSHLKHPLYQLFLFFFHEDGVRT